ncbi:SusC/RagA family TonB-linked outer membrane protein [Mangrovibacterium marinum]|uniref:Iron complex outermembrane receptor protein n=1 Tax=Mangrovibacterium marinum TaxID=1639118 RepID=A0A2T5C303_9BACT|nr:SusC/RagA family TonB-linked outer membrane protein [Mangrovibacterium marinum]PTN09095.1 iron complex outermembrane receptor protein [Mangrovibacterium marinum]
MNLKVNFLRKCATLLVVSFVSVGALFAQDVNVSGTITSSEDSGPLPGASVLEKGTTRGTITNIDGYYQITVPKGTVLIFSFIGMEEQEIKVDASQTLNVVMDPATEGIGEVVVTALGIEREAKALGYAATKVQGEELAKVNTINPVSALQGKAAGLSISGSDGGIFGSSKIEIRGVSTLNNQNNQPIFVVDGVILENDIANVGHYDWAGDANDFGNMLKNLNVDNYESVNVLKGSAATALYGSRGINGAIVIKTKDGKGAKGFGIVVSQTFSVDHVYNQPDFQTKYGPGNYYGNRPYTGDSFGQGYYTTLKNGSSVPSLISAGASRMFGPKYDPNVQIEDYDGTMIPYVPVDNFFVKMYDLGWGSNTNVALRGSDEKGNFYLSTGYTKRNGTSPRNTFEKSSVFFSGSRKLADFLTANASISVTGSEAGNPPINLGENIITSLAWNAMYDPDKWKKRSVYQATHGGVPSSNLGDEYAYVPGNGVWFNAYLNKNVRKETVVRPIVKLTATVTDWMQIMLEANVNIYNTQSENKSLGQGYQNEGGQYSIAHTSDISKTGKLSFLFDHKTGDFTHSLLLHAERWSQRITETGVRTDGGLIVPGQYFIGNSKNTPVLLNNRVSGTKQINSLLYRYSVDWRGQVYLDITGRNDWSSALVYTNISGTYSYFYPSVSGSWLFSDTFEDVMPSWVSFGKLRASWAQVGNDTSPYFINKGYQVGNIEHANGNVITNYLDETIVDTELKPERKNSYEFGLTLNTLKNRLNLDVAYFIDETTNQISTIPLPEASGFSNMLTNVGTIKGKGVELTLTGKPVDNRNFKWTSTFNYWNVKNTITKLHDLVGDYKLLYGDPAYGNYRVGAVAFEGGEYGVLYSDSKAATDSQGRPLMTWHDGVKAPYYKRSGVVEKVGKVRPDFEGSWDNSFQYKAFSFGILLDMRFGGHVASFPARYGTAYGVLETSLDGGETTGDFLSAKNVNWTSKYSGQSYEHGVIPVGVFAEGTIITGPDGNQHDVSGMSWTEAAAADIVDDAVDEGQWAYWYNSWGAGVINPNWFYKLSYIAVRNISIGYNVKLPKYKIQNLNVNLNIRDAGYLYNSSPSNLHPEAARGTGSAQTAFHRTLLPYTRSYTLGLQFTF